MKKQPKHPGALPLSGDGSALSMHLSDTGHQKDYYFWELELKQVSSLPEKDFAVK